MVYGTCLENRRTKVPGVRIPLSPPKLKIRKNIIVPEALSFEEAIALFDNLSYMFVSEIAEVSIKRSYFSRNEKEKVIIEVG